MADTCRSCRRVVVFVRSAKSGKTLILDGKPKVGIVLRNDLGEETTPDDPVASAHHVKVWTDHHATCPAAKSWKGRNRQNPPSLLEPDGGRRGD